MNEYRPDKFVVVKVNDPIEVIYKVFGTWLGGYISGESWRMNSGITMIEEDDDYILFHGYSGSVYRVVKGTYGTSAWSEGILQGAIKASSCPVEIMPEDTDWMSLNSVIIDDPWTYDPEDNA